MHYPCFRYEEESEQKTQEIFWESLRSRIYGLTQSQLRKDIQRVLDPDKILPNTAMKLAYFVGNALRSNVLALTASEKSTVMALTGVERGSGFRKWEDLYFCIRNQFK